MDTWKFNKKNINIYYLWIREKDVVKVMKEQTFPCCTIYSKDLRKKTLHSPTNSIFLSACTITQLPNSKEIKSIIDATFMYKEVVIATFKKHEFVHMCNK